MILSNRARSDLDNLLILDSSEDSVMALASDGVPEYSGTS